MNEESFLSHFDGVRRSGRRHGVAKCPAHSDKNASLTWRQLEDERWLIHCHAGCSAHEVVTAAGLSLSDLFPERSLPHAKGERRPFPAVDVLRAVAYEALIVVSCSRLIQLGEKLNEHDHERLVLAASRIQSALTAAGVQHER